MWYFFCGTLANPQELSRQLAVDYEPVLTAAHIGRGRLQTWCGSQYFLFQSKACMSETPYRAVKAGALLKALDKQRPRLIIGSKVDHIGFMVALETSK